MKKNDFDNHPLWKAVEDNYKSLRYFDDDLRYDETIDQVRATAEYMRRFRSLSDFRLFSEGMLDEMNQLWSSVSYEITWQLNNREQDNSHDLSRAVDRIVNAASNWPQPWGGSEASKAMEEALSQYRRSASEAIDGLKGEKRKLAERFQEIEASRDELRDILQRLQEESERQASRFAEAVDSQNDRFTASQSERSDEFTAWLDSRRSDFDREVVAAGDRLSERETEARELIDSMKTRQEEVEKVASGLASSFLARDFGKYATREFVVSVVIYLMGLLLLGWAGIMLLGAVKDVAPSDRVSWQWVSLKLALTTTVVGGATVCFTLGNRVYRQSTSSKRVELELRALGPFLADLDDGERVKVKSMFADRSFGRAYDLESPRADTDSSGAVSAMSLLNQILENVSKLNSKG